MWLNSVQPEPPQKKIIQSQICAKVALSHTIARDRVASQILTKFKRPLFDPDAYPTSQLDEGYCCKILSPHCSCPATNPHFLVSITIAPNCWSPTELLPP